MTDEQIEARLEALQEEMKPILTQRRLATVGQTKQ
jgi:hypothetical protein